jgi:hypothetical protein
LTYLYIDYIYESIHALIYDSKSELYECIYSCIHTGSGNILHMASLFGAALTLSSDIDSLTCSDSNDYKVCVCMYDMCIKVFSCICMYMYIYIYIRICMMRSKRVR